MGIRMGIHSLACSLNIHVQAAGDTKIQKGGGYALRRTLTWERQIWVQGGASMRPREGRLLILGRCPGRGKFGSLREGSILLDCQEGKQGRLKTRADRGPRLVWGEASHRLWVLIPS